MTEMLMFPVFAVRVAALFTVGMHLCAFAVAQPVSPAPPLAQGLTSLDVGLRPVEFVPVLPVTGINASRLQAEAALRDPRQYAVPLETSITPFAEGLGLVEETWDEDYGGWRLVWRLRLTSIGARSLELGFTTYRMPPGGELFVYTADYDEILGPYTEANNEEHGELWTPILPGAEVVIEVSVPADELTHLKLELGSVIRAFRRFGDLPQSGHCDTHVACYSGSSYRKAIRSVARMTAGGWTCTGALINNARYDRRPFFLTADHCGAGDEPDPAQRWKGAFRPAGVTVYWNDENSSCGGSSRHPAFGSQTGAYLRARNAESDFALLELQSVPSPSHNVHWAGWSRNSNVYPVTAGVHHPAGRRKVISVDADAPVPVNMRWTGVPREEFASDYCGSANNAHCDGLYVYWDEGGHEPGSSGSPLFNGLGRIIGQLAGGPGACGRIGWRGDNRALYGRLRGSWLGGGSRSTRLSDWLDPAGRGVTGIGGLDPLPPNNLVVRSARVNDSTLVPGQRFTFSATVHNVGVGTAPETWLRYHHQPPGRSWSKIDSDYVVSLRGSSSSAESLPLTAPSSTGTHFYTACVRPVAGETDTADNCSRSIRVTVDAAGAPDLEVRARVSDSTPTAGQRFRLYANVVNVGTARSPSTRLLYWQRPEGGSWGTLSGSDSVAYISAGRYRAFSRLLTAPSRSGTYEYTACVDTVPGEPSRNNNCHRPFLTVNVGSGDGAGCTTNWGTVYSWSVTVSGSWTGMCVTRHWSTEFARYYTFTVRGPTAIRIDLTSPSVDTWISLYTGSGFGNERILSDNNGGDGTNARVTQTLAAGTDTIEATTLSGGRTGPYTLTFTAR